MAIIQNPIIGRAKKQAGNMVFNTLNGQNIMKAKPISVGMDMSVEGEKRRAKISAGNELAAKVKSFFMPAYKYNKKTASGYNIFFKNLLDCLDNNNDIDVSLLSSVIFGTGQNNPLPFDIDYTSEPLYFIWHIPEFKQLYDFWLDWFATENELNEYGMSWHVTVYVLEDNAFGSFLVPFVPASFSFQFPKSPKLFGKTIYCGSPNLVNGPFYTTSKINMIYYLYLPEPEE